MDLKNSVFKVKIIKEIIDYSKPWQVAERILATGSSFALSLEEINQNDDNKNGGSNNLSKESSISSYVFVTNSHVVEKAISISIYMKSQPYECDLKYIIPEYDLAIIQPKVEIKGIVPFKIGKSPKQLERVIIAGFPFGGDNISTTEGVVSRIDAVQYFQGLADNIAILIDATVNSGNSGGPAINREGKIAGVAFASRVNAQNMNYIIPNAILKLFLRLYMINFKWTGISFMPIETRNIQNDTLKNILISNNENKNKNENENLSYNGIVVTKIYPMNLGVMLNDLKVSDVIVSINDHLISGNGKVQWNDQYIDYDLYVNMMQPYTDIKVGIIRNKKPITIMHKLLPKDMLIPKSEIYSPLSYAIIYGLVFLPLSYPLIDSFNVQSYNYVSQLVKSMDHVYEFEEFPALSGVKSKQQIIILNEILPDEKNKEYEGHKRRLISINDVRIFSIEHLLTVILKLIKSKEKLLKFTFEKDFIYIDCGDETTMEKFIQYQQMITKNILGTEAFLKV